jgi:hypothetical protein
MTRWASMRDLATLIATVCCVWMNCAQAQFEGSALGPLARSGLVGDWIELPLPGHISSRFKVKPTIHYDCEYLRFRDDGRIDKVSLAFGARGGVCPDEPAIIHRTLDSVPASNAGSQFDHRIHPSGHTLLTIRGQDQPNGNATWLLLAAVKEEVLWDTVQIRVGDLLMFLFMPGQSDPLRPVSYMRWLRPLPRAAQQLIPTDPPPAGR